MSGKAAIATSQHQLPPSDQALVDALVRVGCDARPSIWSDPSISWKEYDAVIVRSCWDYHLRCGEFLTWIANLERDGITVLNPPALIRWNHDKIYLRELAAKGVPIPGTIFLAEGESLDLEAACASRGWTAAVVKPRISASAWRTECRTAGVVRGPMLIQEYVKAIEDEGEWSLVYVQGRFSHAVVKRPCKGDFRVQREFGGQVQEADPPALLVKFADAALEKLESPSLFARVDLIGDRGNIWLMELELIEPDLFLEVVPGAAARVADCIVTFLSRQTYTPFRKRQVRTEGMLETRGWRLKVYSVTCEDQPPARARFAAGIDWTVKQLPPSDPVAGRPGLGFLILHAGRGADYAVLCWWDRENELPMRIAVREQQDGAHWRMAGPCEGVCVWDLEIIARERDAYVKSMLVGKSRSEAVQDYLNDCLAPDESR